MWVIEELRSDGTWGIAAGTTPCLHRRDAENDMRYLAEKEGWPIEDYRVSGLTPQKAWQSLQLDNSIPMASLVQRWDTIYGPIRRDAVRYNSLIQWLTLDIMDRMPNNLQEYQMVYEVIDQNVRSLGICP